MCSFTYSAPRFLGISADLAESSRTASVFGSRLNKLERVHKIRPPDRRRCHGGRVPNAARGQLIHGFVCESAGALSHSHRTFFVDAGRHDAKLAMPRRNICSNSGRSAGSADSADLPGTNHVQSRDTFGDADDQFQFGVGRFHDRVRSVRRGTKIIEVSAAVSRTACCTVLKMGHPSWVVPPLPGVTPPKICVPYSAQALAWKVPSLPVSPCRSPRRLINQNAHGWFMPLNLLACARRRHDFFRRVFHRLGHYEIQA